jgi:hypothetical protein
MYLASPGGLTDPQVPTTLAMRERPFRILDRFGFDQALLTPRLKLAVRDLAQLVIRSLGEPRPIRVVRLKGHTDSTGKERYNLGLGDRRARVIEALLKAALKARAGSVRIMIEASPGKSEPRTDNRSSDSRAQNRRVEVFVTLAPSATTSVPTSATPPTAPPTGKPSIDLTIKTLPPKSVIITDPEPYWQNIPAPKPGSSIRQRLEQALSSIPKSIRSRIIDLAEKGACSAAAALAERAGGGATAKQAVEQSCKALVRSPAGVHGLDALGEPAVDAGIRATKRRLGVHLARYKKLAASGAAGATAANKRCRSTGRWFVSSRSSRT